MQAFMKMMGEHFNALADEEDKAKAKAAQACCHIRKMPYKETFGRCSSLHCHPGTLRANRLLIDS